MDKILRKRPNPGLPYAIVALGLLLFVVLKFIVTVVLAAQAQPSELWRAEKARQESKLRTEKCQPTENFSKDVKAHNVYSGETYYSVRRQFICEDGSVAWKSID